MSFVMWPAMEPMRLRPARGCAPACGAARTRRREGRWVGDLSSAALLCLVGRRGASRQPRRAGFATVEKVKPKRKSLGGQALRRQSLAKVWPQSGLCRREASEAKAPVSS